MSYNPLSQITFADSGAIDSFSRMRVSNPTGVFDCQFTYDLQPLIFEQITSGTGATIAHDATNRNALMTFSSTATGGKAYMQAYQCSRYQPGKSQLVFITFNMIASVANVLKFAGISDGTNGVEFQNDGANNKFVIYSGTTLGNQSVSQGSWNLDKLDGTGASGLTLDITKSQILVIDFQALYVGRVRIGFDIGGIVVYAHQFVHANLQVHPYLQDASLPIRCGMTCSGTVTTTMKFQCSSVISEGGVERTLGYEFSQDSAVTAGNGTYVHALSVRPKLTFNGIQNRVHMGVVELDMMVTGNSGVIWQLVLGQAITGTTTYTDVNTNYSAYAYNTAGTISGTPALVIDQGYCYSKTNSSMALTQKYPISLDAAGAVRALGTISVIVQGVGATSATQVALKWVEMR